jgi:peptidyl-prolyl cis-trans isomerase SurA
MKAMMKPVGALLCAVAVLVAAAAAPLTARAAGQEGIAAVVNDQAITTSDVADRMKLLMTSSGMPDTPEIREKMRGQVVNILIDEAIRMQEVHAQDIDVDDTAVDEGFATIAQQNNMTAEQFETVLKRSNLNINTLRDQIRSQIGWSRLVEAKMSNQVEISEFDVDAALDRMRANAGKTEYLLAEIFLPVDSAQEENDVRQLADRLSAQLRAGGVRFSALAGQFSQAAGASKGGDLGWVQEGVLAPELDAALAQTAEGQITPPVRTLTGFHILLLRQKRIANADTLPPREEVFHRLAMQQLDRVQRRYFLNLKGAAFIDRRGV